MGFIMHKFHLLLTPFFFGTIVGLPFFEKDVDL